MRDATPHPRHGRNALDDLHRLVGLDEAHTLRHDDGFTWWPGAVPVRFRWRAPGADDAAPVWRVSAEVDVAEGLPEGAATDAVLALLSRRFHQVTPVLEDGVLRFHAHAPTWPEAGPAPLVGLVYRAGYALHVAERVLPKLLGTGVLGRVGPRLLHSAHPDAGPRPEPAAQLAALVDAAAHRGAAPATGAARPDLELAAAALRAVACGPVAGPDGSSGVNVVVETRRTSALLEIVADQRDPDVGHGLMTLLRVRFPQGHAHGSPAQLARALNRAEVVGGAPLLGYGAWTTNVPGADVAYSAFVPHLLHHRGLAQEVALDGVQRARWAFDLFGDTEPFGPGGPYARVLLGRF